MEALCDHMKDCCTAAGFLYDLSYDPSVCMSGNTPADLVDLATHYPEQAAICLEQIRTLACNQRIEGCEPPEEVGVIPLDGRCEESSQCAPQPDMVTKCDVETLRCVATPRPSNLGLPCYGTCEGGVCFDPTDPEDDRVACIRERGLYCDGEVCQPVISVGEACDEDSECVAGALCVDDTCWGEQPVGDECRKTTRYSETIDTCAATSYCDDTNHCVAKKGIGEDCASNEECFSDRCLHDGICLAELGVPECR
ncbi:MAG: hypothetical protein JW751_02870 [Polyangiaceae bacterium]|nr:hypothetical protein [Polyangiaceae bacterium]